MREESVRWGLLILLQLFALPAALAIPVEKSPCGGGESFPVHLSFDDGPQMPETMRILDLLKKEGIKATFFISSSRFAGFAEGNPTRAELERLKILKRIIKEGHVVGSHSNEHIEHANPGVVSPKAADENLARNEAILQSLGLDPPMPFRFPYGSGWFENRNGESQKQADRMMAKVKAKGFEPVHWDVDTWDWSKIKRKALPGSVLRQICSHRGGIVLMHDIQAFTADNLPALVESIRRSGHHFVSLSEMKALDRKRPAENRFTSLASRAAGIYSCRRSVGDFDQVWPSCREYESSSSDIVNPKRSGSAQ